MTDVKAILNDIYPVYKKFHQDKDMKSCNESFQQISKKYDNNFCTNILLSFTAVINEEMEK